jgi:hypothetical protein
MDWILDSDEQAHQIQERHLRNMTLRLWRLWRCTSRLVAARHT